MTSIINALLLLYVLYRIKAPWFTFVILIAVFIGDMAIGFYRMGEEYGKDGE